MITGFIATIIVGTIAASIKNAMGQLNDSGIKLSKYAEYTLIFMAVVTFFGSAWLFTYIGWWDPPSSNVWNG